MRRLRQGTISPLLSVRVHCRSASSSIPQGEQCMILICRVFVTSSVARQHSWEQVPGKSNRFFELTLASWATGLGRSDYPISHLPISPCPCTTLNRNWCIGPTADRTWSDRLLDPVVHSVFSWVEKRRLCKPTLPLLFPLFHTVDRLLSAHHIFNPYASRHIHID